jgi:magnesium-transporting ATPase (P-type)
MCLALCHQVTPVTDVETGTTEFQAASPDEISMVDFATRCGVTLLSRVTLRRVDAETGEVGGQMVDMPLDTAIAVERVDDTGQHGNADGCTHDCAPIAS